MCFINILSCKPVKAYFGSDLPKYRFDRKYGRNSSNIIRSWGSLASDEVCPEKTYVSAEIAVKMNYRRMVAVTSASPKAGVVASMLC